MVKRVLVANRGEIAVRVIKACHDLNIEAVAVFSECDRDALHVSLANDAVCIGPSIASKSYLNASALLIAARLSECDALHPGYGFLSENAEFVAACVQAGLTFIGPAPEHVRLMGDKARAREAAASAGVPIIVGLERQGAEDAEYLELAKTLGFPLLLKATSGGGGRGMWKISSLEELLPTLSRARGEATALFGDGDVYMEKYLENARHVEVQVLADTFGNVIHLGERDCSIQRRHQKLLEESPCTEISAELRNNLCQAAVALTRRCGYVGAGTVEFMLDLDRNEFFFIEMNTRIQVEHPVSEMVTGIDLVTSQIRIAAGESLPWGQEQITLDGHAIECRINAERPERGFLPSPGKITVFDPPMGDSVRCDTHCFSGYTIPPFYDSLIAKVIVHGANRREAVERMTAALLEFNVEGIHTTIPLHLALLDDQEFRDGNYNTRWMEEEFMPRFKQETSALYVANTASGN